MIEASYETISPGPRGPVHPFYLGLVRPAYIDIEAMTRETSVGSDHGECSYYFDQTIFEENWRKSTPFLLVFVCPWNLTSGTDLKQARGLGLILRNAALEGDEAGSRSREIDYKHSFVRVGVFQMIYYDAELVGWSRKKLRLV